LATKVDVIDALEHYLREAPIETICPLKGGKGHPGKMTLALRGGVGVVAKPGNDDKTRLQAHREVAARILAVELGLADLVPVTVLRSMPSGAECDAETMGSAQVLWPWFKIALETKFTARTCPGGAETSWPIAIFDWLAANGDRHLGNWGVLQPHGREPRVVLIDHGHAFDRGGPGEFANHHRGDEVPPGLLEQVAGFARSRDSSGLNEVLAGDAVERVFARADDLVATETLGVR